MQIPKLKVSMLWGIAKDLIGKDISRFSLPVFLNEPISILQKGAEMVFFANKNFQKAIAEEDPVMRLVYVATYAAGTYSFVRGRCSKPFNPLLGETFEVLTPEFRFVAEAVSHHPPVASVNCQGAGWEIEKSLQTFIKLTTKNVVVQDFNPLFINIEPKSLNGQVETYTFETPKMTIGNLVVGEKYIEPAGIINIKNITSGELCIMNFKPR
jgi:hypothetical protein